MVQFVEKRIDELFDVQLSDGDNKPNELPKGNIPLVSSGDTNQGIVGYFKTNTTIYPKLSVTLDMFGNCFLQSNAYQAVSHGRINILLFKNNNLDELSRLFLVTCINKVTKNNQYGFSNMLSSTKVKPIKIQVPVTATGALDTDYMASYVRKIEASYVRKIEAYLSILGYKSMADVKLTEHEQKLLAGGIQAQPTSKFRVGDLFDVLASNSKINALAIKKISALPKSNLVPYVVRTSLNNGIKGYIDIQQYQLNDANTFSFAQDTAEIFYQTKPYVTGDKIKVLVPKNKSNYKQALFLLTAIRKSFSLFQWGSSSFSENVIKLTYIILPVTSSGDPDWQFMEDYITAIEKLKVLKLKQFLDHKLDLYQQAIK